MKALAVLVLALGTVGCEGSDETSVDAAVVDALVPDTAEPDAPLDAPSPVACDQDLPMATPVGPGEPVSMSGNCGGAPVHVSPARGCRLDLRDHVAGDVGTCASDTVIEIPVAQLPIVIDLPEGTSDAACGARCGPPGEPAALPAFGLRVRVVQLPQGGDFLSMRVDPPWRLVAGNECQPSLCADGYPSINEFGRPLACVFTYCHEVGVITDDPSPPPARLTIIEDPTSNEFSNCCLFPTE